MLHTRRRLEPGHSESQAWTHRPVLRLLCVAACVGLAVACSPPGTPGGSVGRPLGSGALVGSLSGLSLNVRDAIFHFAPSTLGPASSGSGHPPVLLIALTDFPDACAAVHDGSFALRMDTNSGRRFSRYVSLFISSLEPGPNGLVGFIHPGPVQWHAPDFGGGSHSIPTPTVQFGFPDWGVNDVNCHNQASRSLQGLRVEMTLTHVDVRPTGVVAGRLLVAQGGQQISGEFAARYCPLPRNPPPRDLPCR